MLLLGFGTLLQILSGKYHIYLIIKPLDWNVPIALTSIVSKVAAVSQSENLVK
jgi:hypothetical protein